jgi:hypothetical protein
VQSIQMKSRQLLQGDWHSDLVKKYGLNRLAEREASILHLKYIVFDWDDPAYLFYGRGETAACLLPTHETLGSDRELYRIMIRPALDSSGNSCWKRVGHFFFSVEEDLGIDNFPWEYLMDHFLRDEIKMKAITGGNELPQPLEESLYDGDAGEDEKGNKLTSSPFISLLTKLDNQVCTNLRRKLLCQRCPESGNEFCSSFISPYFIM